MQDKYNKYYEHLNLSELYSFDDLNKLFKIIPELSDLFTRNKNMSISIYSEKKNSSNEKSENINCLGKSLKINKFHFFKIILSKLKSYFEINESFIIMKTISILINEIKSLEKYFILNLSSPKSKSKQKSDKKNELKNKSLKKPEKIEKGNYKFPNATKKINITNNGLSNQNSYFNKDLKRKVYFRVLDSQLKKENKTEIIFSKLNYDTKKKNKKNINLNLNKTERNISNINLSLSNVNNYEFQRIQKQNNPNNTSDLDFNILLDSDNNVRSHNFSTNFDNKSYFATIENKSDLYNNNNNLYINIYGQKKGNGNSTENTSLYISNQNQKKIDINDEKNSKKENIRNKINLNLSLINDIETENFNIFDLDKKTSGKSLILISCYIFNRFGFHSVIKYSMFENWCCKIASGYNSKNPYHNDIHAGDITQTCLTFFKIGKINEICKLSQLSKCALFLSCICHDYKHPGVNNNFLKDTRNILAIKYNDNSILENMHISEAFKLTLDYPNCDIFSGMNSDNYKQIRKEMISCVLYTDMTMHQKTIDFMKTIINNNNNIKKGKKEEIDNHQDYMNLMVHSADISNPTKKFEIYWKWAQVVVEEFFQQGDKEKELGLKCSFDRETMTVYQNQLGFINYIVIPFFTTFTTIFTKLKYLLDNINNNKNEVLSLQEKNKEKGNKNEKSNIIKK